ncbi:MAG TPA: cupin domain-containing protein [Candidatus Binataceae bacterium]|jgi:mannose-6-phosphate isomerase-like protein (cupin superfamily)
MVRRVVSGQESSRVIIDGNPARVFGQDGFSLAEIWATEAPAPDLKSERDIAVGFQRVSMELAPGASRFRIVEFPATDAPGLMHKTPTIDYLVLLEGEIDLLFDNGSEVHLKQGDCVVQLGAMHAWHNRSGRPTRMAAVAVGGVGGESTHR